MLDKILKYGLPIGLVVIGITIVSIHFGFSAQWLGYLVMLLSFSLIYLALHQLREASGGVLPFRTALTAGLGIALMASIVYVVVWEIYLLTTEQDFMADYAQSVIDAKIAAGAHESEIAETRVEMQAMQDQYAQLTFRLPITFLEIFPVGALVSLICALVLRTSGHQES